MIADSPTDESLMRRVMQDDRHALEELLRRYLPRLMGLLRRMIGNRDQLEETVQEIAILLWQKRDRYDASRPFRPWFFALAMNKCRESMRRRESVLVESLDPVPATIDSAQSSVEQIIHREELAAMNRLIDLLPTNQKTVLLYRIWEELSYAEIAQIMDIPEPTVRSHMHLALKSLRIQMSSLIH